MNADFTKRVEKVDKGVVVGYENTSRKNYDVELNFSGSTNMDITDLFGAESGEFLKARKVLGPGEAMTVRLTSVDLNQPYGYKVVMEGEEV